ncbi:MAG TPA: galactokinase family protein, partial [Blastocatellia bacterium]|nr:galactokinase family protein [Blastocatellia bacterium]
MYRIVHKPSQDLPDTADFVETLNTVDQNSRSEVRGLFELKSDIIVARAPGRLDVMGGIADYSGSLVLQKPIQEATFVALQRDPIRKLTLISLSDDPSRQAFFEMSLADFEADGKPVDYDTAHAYFERDPARHWAAYVAGAFIVLMRERGVRFANGARILIASRVPEGKGVSSSAALEVAAMQAVAAAHDIAIASRE